MDDIDSSLDSSDPNIPDHFPYKDFIQKFYSFIDAPHEHDRYVNCFSPDASAVFGTTRVTGRAGMISAEVSTSSEADLKNRNF